MKLNVYLCIVFNYNSLNSVFTVCDRFYCLLRHSYQKVYLQIALHSINRNLNLYTKNDVKQKDV